jgi:hypothetical protein
VTDSYASFEGEQTMEPMPFISYARQDFPFVRDLVRSLRQQGIDSWFDIADIAGGDAWLLSIL